MGSFDMTGVSVMQSTLPEVKSETLLYVLQWLGVRASCIVNGWAVGGLIIHEAGNQNHS